MKFYIYRHIRLDTNTPFYVGKGSGNRAYSKNRNLYWKNIAKSVGYRVEIIIKNLTEEQAFSKEIEFIKLYKDLGQCEANLTDGGEGPSGYIPTKEHRDKLSKAVTGAKNPRFNPNKIIKVPQKGRITCSKMVINTVTGEKFKSAKEASVKNHIKYHTLVEQLNGKRTNNTNFKYITIQ